MTMKSLYNDPRVVFEDTPLYIRGRIENIARKLKQATDLKQIEKTLFVAELINRLEGEIVVLQKTTEISKKRRAEVRKDLANKINILTLKIERTNNKNTILRIEKTKAEFVFQLEEWDHYYDGIAEEEL